jgi:hypothetical protein
MSVFDKTTTEHNTYTQKYPVVTRAMEQSDQSNLLQVNISNLLQGNKSNLL